MTLSERAKLVKSYLGRVVDIEIDRPVGFVHKKKTRTLTYPINYGYIPGVLGGDGEELDVYLMGVSEPVEKYHCRIIGIVYRKDDNEDKLIAAPEGRLFYQNEIAEAIHFQEKYYKTRVEALYEKSSGAVVFTRINGEIRYLLIKSPNGDIGVPKGHIEFGETEAAAALREIFEETSVRAKIVDGFREVLEYTMPNKKHKTAVYYVAEYCNQTPCHNDGFEDNEYFVVPFSRAYELLTFDNMKSVLKKADEFINSKGE